MTAAEFQTHIAQNIQWAIHERNWLRAGGHEPSNKQPRPPFDVVKLWEMVPADTRDFFELAAEVAIGMCEAREGRG